MAGIIGLRAEDMEQVDALQRARLDWPDGLPMIRPHVLAPVIVRTDDALDAMPARFGFSRRFASFNARSDRLTTGRMWKSMFGKSHGIVPVSYVVEWVNDEDGKTPYLIQRADGRPMMAPALVGPYHEDRKQKAFAICTREPNPFFKRFHDRMIGQCTPKQMDAWLAPEGHEPDDLLACIAAPPNDELVAVPTTPQITKRKAGDWSPLEATGDPLTWNDLKRSG
jgi:putative SOS response-associated peptidase YedK